MYHHNPTSEIRQLDDQESTVRWHNPTSSKLTSTSIKGCKKNLRLLILIVKLHENFHHNEQLHIPLFHDVAQQWEKEYNGVPFYVSSTTAYPVSALPAHDLPPFINILHIFRIRFRTVLRVERAASQKRLPAEL